MDPRTQRANAARFPVKNVNQPAMVPDDLARAFAQQIQAELGTRDAKIAGLSTSLDELAKLRSSSAKREAEQAARLDGLESRLCGMEYAISGLKSEMKELRDATTQSCSQEDPAILARMTSMEGKIKAVAAEQLKMHTVF